MAVLMQFLILLSCIALSFFFYPFQHVSATTINVTDGSSLLLFRTAISVDPHGVFAQWNDTVHFCKWHGITCGGPRHRERVVALRLPSLDLVGTISPALSNLTFLRSINLSSNHFNGEIPSQLANLSRLESLVLNANSLQGHIPSEFGSLPSLTTLRLRKNSITGQIPPTLANASSLIFLDLSFNNLSGVIPPSLGKLPNLILLTLGYNHLGGNTPPALWNLSSLKILTLESSGLYGSLPQDIGQKLPNLRYFSLVENNLHGEIPSSLANASQLYNIQLATNRFSGTIPATLGRLQYLEWLLLFQNQLEAKEPNGWSFVDSLTNCTLLTHLALSFNNLGGQLPNSIANLSTSLQILDIGANDIHGSIPQDIGNLVGLTWLGFATNALTGHIPVSLSLLNNLNSLSLNNNNLSGEIPNNIGSLSRLSQISLDSNSIGGSIPRSLGNCKSLGVLHLGDNKLTGTIPKEVVSLYTLSEIYLSNNLLQGSIPSEIGSLINLGALYMSRNKLSGEMPPNIGNCQLLRFLYLDGNLFQGSIPTSVSALWGLQELDLSQNNFSGKVPIFLENFHDLYVLNLSSNNFEGELPTKRIFANISGVSVLENHKLCGGNSMLRLQTCYVSVPKKKHKSLKIAIIISVLGTFICLFLLLVLGVVRYWILEKSRRKPTIDNPNPIGDQYVNVSYAQLVKATDGFSEENLIGFGSCGSVYRGKIEVHEHDIRDVAVKVFNLQQGGALKSFIAECDAYRNIRHRNLIKIITACSSIDFRGNDFKAIVFEFKVNGSLESWLHPEQHDHYGLKNLSLIQRINIAIDVASALEYLHHHSENPIIHCDLKPSNILLDDDMMALVSDFGIVKFMKKSMENTTSSLGIKGTIGYIAPEYGMTSMVSTYGDVYSYGILLFELFTGKRPTDGTFKEGLSLRSFVEIAFPERIVDIIDTRILQEGIDAPTEFTQNDGGFLDCVTSIIGIGLSCTKDSPMDRMEMTIVTSELKEMRRSFLEN